MINKLHINEEYPTSPNSIVNDKIAEFVKYLETNGIKVADVSYSNKAIYINKLIDAKKALHCLKTDFYPTRQLGVMIYCPYIMGNIEKILPVEACMVENKQKGKNNMIRRIKNRTVTEALTGSVPVIRNPRQGINVDTKTELILDLLLGMRCIYSKGSDATSIGYLKNNEFIVAFVDPNKDSATFLKFENLTDDDTDDIITVLSEGASIYDTFLEDYNPTKYSFWEFMIEQLY